VRCVTLDAFMRRIARASRPRGVLVGRDEAV
jgi:hypothetical protein